MMHKRQTIIGIERQAPLNKLELTTLVVNAAQNDSTVLAVAVEGSKTSPASFVFTGTFEIFVGEEVAAVQEYALAFARRLGNLCYRDWSSESRLECFYCDSPAHVRFLFSRISDLEQHRIKDRYFIWNRKTPASKKAERGTKIQSADGSQFEAKLWLAVHSAISRLHRGELFEAIRALNSIRVRFLAPLAAKTQDKPGRGGVQYFEEKCPGRTVWLSNTVQNYGQEPCRTALQHTLNAILNFESAVVDRQVHKAMEYFLEEGSAERISGLATPARHSHLLQNGQLPSHLFRFLELALSRVQEHGEILGVAAVGSWLGPGRTSEVGSLDNFSDLDLYVMLDDSRRTDEQWQAEVVAALAPSTRVRYSRRGRYFACLHEDPLVRVDLEFVTKEDMHRRYELPSVLWERNAAMTEALARGTFDPSMNLWKQPSAIEIEPRFWIAAFDCATAIAEGRLFQAVSELTSMRSKLLGPLAAIAAGEPSRGMRRFEFRFPTLVDRFAATVPEYDTKACFRSLTAGVSTYTFLRQMTASPVTDRSCLESTVMKYIHFLGTTITN